MCDRYPPPIADGRAIEPNEPTASLCPRRTNPKGAGVLKNLPPCDLTCLVQLNTTPKEKVTQQVGCFYIDPEHRKRCTF